jgi:hypothetical protein
MAEEFRKLNPTVNPGASRRVEGPQRAQAAAYGEAEKLFNAFSSNIFDRMDKQDTVTGTDKGAPSVKFGELDELGFPSIERVNMDGHHRERYSEAYLAAQDRTVLIQYKGLFKNAAAKLSTQFKRNPDAIQDFTAKYESYYKGVIEKANDQRISGLLTAEAINRGQAAVSKLLEVREAIDHKQSVGINIAAFDDSTTSMLDMGMNGVLFNADGTISDTALSEAGTASLALSNLEGLGMSKDKIRAMRQTYRVAEETGKAISEWQSGKNPGAESAYQMAFDYMKRDSTLDHAGRVSVVSNLLAHAQKLVEVGNAKRNTAKRSVEDNIRKAKSDMASIFNKSGRPPTVVEQRRIHDKYGIDHTENDLYANFVYQSLSIANSTDDSIKVDAEKLRANNASMERDRLQRLVRDGEEGAFQKASDYFQKHRDKVTSTWWTALVKEEDGRVEKYEKDLLKKNTAFWLHHEKAAILSGRINARERLVWALKNMRSDDSELKLAAKRIIDNRGKLFTAQKAHDDSLGLNNKTLQAGLLNMDRGLPVTPAQAGEIQKHWEKQDSLQGIPTTADSLTEQANKVGAVSPLLANWFRASILSPDFKEAQAVFKQWGNLKEEIKMNGVPTEVRTWQEKLRRNFTKRAFDEKTYAEFLAFEMKPKDVRQDLKGRAEEQRRTFAAQPQQDRLDAISQALKDIGVGSDTSIIEPGHNKTTDPTSTADDDENVLFALGDRSSILDKDPPPLAGDSFTRTTFNQLWDVHSVKPQNMAILDTGDEAGYQNAVLKDVLIEMRDGNYYAGNDFLHPAILPAAEISDFQFSAFSLLGDALFGETRSLNAIQRSKKQVWSSHPLSRYIGDNYRALEDGSGVNITTRRVVTEAIRRGIFPGAVPGGPTLGMRVKSGFFKNLRKDFFPQDVEELYDGQYVKAVYNHGSAENGAATWKIFLLHPDLDHDQEVILDGAWNPKDFIDTLVEEDLEEFWSLYGLGRAGLQLEEDLWNSTWAADNFEQLDKFKGGPDAPRPRSE